MVVRSGFEAKEFDEKSYLGTLLGFGLHWDYRNYIDYISQKIVNLTSTIKIHLKRDVINASIINGVQQPIFYNFLLDKPPGYKIFCEPQTIHYRNINKTVFNTILFQLQIDNREQVNFNGQTLTSILQLFKI